MQEETISHLPDRALLAMLLGGDLAADLAGMSLAKLFGLEASGYPGACESEAAYLAQPAIAAARELFRRALQARLERQDVILGSPREVRQFLTLRMADLPYEVFGVMLLDTQNHLIRYDELFRGTLTQTSVYPREVVKHALAYNAAAAIFAHNHPSGVAEPSLADEHLTANLKQALGLVDVKVLDHMIVAGGAVLSFAERGLL